ncbi:uncharacterized protein LOC142576522 isoform X2 [Dermacentor variabilis]|uniref:uncharacterized protein LOC142576522 isoform X2 n=1 Tax=Dermacentor variabilis TaxID=34621 RepID=UPI003F5B9F6F
MTQSSADIRILQDTCEDDEESPSSEQTAMEHHVGHASPEEPSCLKCPVLKDNVATAQCHLQADLQNNQASACMMDKGTADLLSAHISSLEEENHRLQHDLDSARSRLAKAAPGERDVLRSNPDMVWHSPVNRNKDSRKVA